MLDETPAVRAESRSPEWYKTATRWAQLTLVENDPESFDLDFWLDVFKRTKSNATCLSAGGYIAYYPSEVPLHYVSKYLKGRDIFGELVDGSRALGMHVMARVDPHAIHQEAADAHPEWIQKLADGSPRRHWSYPSVWITCALGDYNRDFMPKVVKEICERYDIDAIFANRWAGHGICYCDSCKTNFKADTGRELPKKPDPTDGDWLAWQDWRSKRLTAQIANWNSVVKSVRPHARYIPNMGAESILEYDLGFIKETAPILFCDHQGRAEVTAPWANGRNAKRLRGGLGDWPLGGLTGICPGDRHRWKDGVHAPAELQMWLTAGAGQGLRPWFTKFNATHPDERWVEPLVDFYQQHHRIEPSLAGTTPWAEIAVLDPSTTLRAYDHEARKGPEQHELGVYHALVEAGLPFEFMSDRRLDEPVLKNYKVLVAANAARLSDAQCKALRDYVAAGGGLVAGYETSLYDESGKRRKDFGLADLFGVSLAGETRGPLQNTYMSIDVDGKHPLTRPYGTARRMLGGTRHVPVKVTGDAAVPFKFFPDFPDLPMEEVYPRGEPDAPAVVARELPGGGRVVFMPFNIGEIFWDMLQPDHGALIEGALRWAMKARPTIEVSGKGVVDMAVREGKDATVVHLVNLTNPMMMKGPLREWIPCPEQTISVAVPAGREVTGVRLVVAGKEAATRRDGDRLLITVPPFEREEVVRIERKG